MLLLFCFVFSETYNIHHAKLSFVTKTASKNKQLKYQFYGLKYVYRS